MCHSGLITGVCIALFLGEGGGGGGGGGGEEIKEGELSNGVSVCRI